jgi:hypothetical protein
MADERKGFLLRLPPQLLDELRRWAEQDMRSLNGQIEWLLRDALRKRTGRAGMPASDEQPDGEPPSGA